jgi:hypothetical protein
MRFSLGSLLIALALMPLLLAEAWWAFSSEEAMDLVVTIALFVVAVWLTSRAVIFLNTRM